LQDITKAQGRTGHGKSGRNIAYKIREVNMELALANIFFNRKAKNSKAVKQHNLTHAEVNRPYVIRGIDTDDRSVKDFLFTLGCYEGEKVTVISVLADNYIIHVKDARYSIDRDLAKAILI